VIHQELASMTVPHWFQQSIEILVVEEREGFSCGAKHCQCGIEESGDVLTVQETLTEESIAIGGIMAGGNGSEKREVGDKGREQRKVDCVEDPGK
jgi:hypothetical protein